jgi:hypothetical protein
LLAASHLGLATGIRAACKYSNAMDGRWPPTTGTSLDLRGRPPPTIMDLVRIEGLRARLAPWRQPGRSVLDVAVLRWALGVSMPAAC